MIPDLASVMRKRYRMERTIRLAAVVLFALWLVNFLEALSQVLVGALDGRFGVWQSVVGGVLTTTPLLIGAAFLGALSGRLARWILPIPKTGCPRCGYRLLALVEPRCPECGLGLPRELMGDSNK